MGCSNSVPEIDEPVEKKSHFDDFDNNLKLIKKYIMSVKDSSTYLTINELLVCGDLETFRGEISNEFLDILTNIRQINGYLLSARNGYEIRLNGLKNRTPHLVVDFVRNNAIICEYSSSETNKDVEEMIALYEYCRAIRTVSKATMRTDTFREEAENKLKRTIKNVISARNCLKEAA